MLSCCNVGLAGYANVRPYVCSLEKMWAAEARMSWLRDDGYQCQGYSAKDCLCISLAAGSKKKWVLH